MASPAEFDKGGVYLLLFLFAALATIIGFVKGAKCGTWHCSYIFLGLAVFFLIAAIQQIFS